MSLAMIGETLNVAGLQKYDWVDEEMSYRGGYTLWRFALFYPERCIDLASIWWVPSVHLQLFRI